MKKPTRKIRKPANNMVCTPTLPPKAIAKARSYLAALLAGHIINRMTVDVLGIGQHNESANSTISVIRNKLFVPVNSPRGKAGTADYSMSPVEIMRYNNPDQRTQQHEEMRAHVEELRLTKNIGNFSKSLDQMSNRKTAWINEVFPQSQRDDISRRLSALLTAKKKGASKKR